MAVLRFESRTDSIELPYKGNQVIEGASVSVNEFNPSGFSRRLGAKDRYSRDGVIITGDQNIGSRTVSIRLTASSENSGAVRAFYARFAALFDRYNAPTYLIIENDTEEPYRPVRAKVALQTDGLLSGSRFDMHALTGSVTLVLVDGCFETVEEFSAESEGGETADGETLIVENGSRMTAYPVISVSPTTPNYLFRLTNTTTGAFVEIGSPEIDQSKTVVISSISDVGGITIDDVNISASAIGPGTSMIELVPGENVLSYSSAYGSANISIRWRERWLI